MGNENSKSTAKSATASVSVQPKNAVPRQRMNIQMVQNVLLIWLDSNIDEKSADCRNTMTQLRRAVNSINTYTDGEECIQFLETMVQEKACMIISGSLGKHLVPRVHNMSQMDSIFIFCSNKEYHEVWAKEWPKIKGVFTEIGSICEALKKAAQQCEQDSMAISFVATSGDTSKKNLDQLSLSFMYTQILKEILLSITFKQQHINEFVQYCREALAENEDELKNVKKFEGQYRKQTPIWWYTFECFLYPMINRTLRLLDADMIVTMGFFIADLHRHIEKLHRKQFGNHHSGARFIVYRGQGLSKEDFEQMSQTKGGLICFNNFLSTSKDRNVSLRFAHGAIANPEMMGVLFIMTIDPTQSSTPFASITNVSYFKKTEDEMLFSMHTVFRIGEITPMDGNDRLFQVKLTLTSDNDKDLRVPTDRIRVETNPDSTGWYPLGQVLLNMGQSEKAQQVYEILLGQTTDEFERGRLYDRLGLAHDNKGDYQEAIGFYEKSLEMYNRIRPPPSSNLADSYSNIGNVYDSMGDYPKALSSHEKALAIRQQSLPPNHPDLAVSYSNIGNVYDSMGDYLKALSSHEKALAIRQQSLPSNHPDLAVSYNNIGNVYYNMGDNPKALSSHEKALAIRQQSLPPNHPDLASTYNNIGLVCDNMSDYPKALSSHEKALAIRQQSLPQNHPDLASTYNNIGLVYDNMGDYLKALSSHEKALTIRQQSLPPNHPDLASTYNNIGLVYDNMGDYPKALSSHEKALAIRQQSLPPNHPDLASTYNNIGLVYDNMGDYLKALSSHEKALAVKQQSLPPNHPSLAVSYGHIGNVYFKMGEHLKALPFCQLAVDIAQRSLPSNHPHLQWYKNNLEKVKKEL